MDINEVACGDPTCAPVDTIFTLIWEGTGKGVFAMPMMANEITQEDLIDFFPVCVLCARFYCLIICRIMKPLVCGRLVRRPDGQSYLSVDLLWVLVWSAELDPILSRAGLLVKSLNLITLNLIGLRTCKFFAIYYH